MWFINRMLIFILFISFVGCTKEIPFPSIEDESFLVVNAYLSPEEKIQVHVSRNCHINDATCQFNFVPDAEVIIKYGDNDELVQLDHQENGIYSLDNFSLDYETAYLIDVDHKDQSVYAACQTPKPFVSRYIGKEETFYGEYNVWAFDVEIDDIKGEENYYLLEAFIELDDRNPESFYSRSYHYSNDIYAENNEITAGIDDLDNGLYKIFLPDKNFDGERHSTRILLKDWGIRFGNSQGVPIHISIKSVNKEMYEYEKSLERYRLTQFNIFSEPEQIYSNIENGLGIFTAYTEQRFLDKMPESDLIFPTSIEIQNNDCVAPCVIGFSTDGDEDLLYTWSFGDSDFSFEPNPIHTYTMAGSYRVSLSARDGAGNSVLHTETVTIQ